LESPVSRKRGSSTVVLLHGLAGSATEWIETAEALADEFHVVALDLRGHGQSSRRPADTTRRGYVEDVAAVISAASLGSPAHVVGQSMGGHTAMLLAAWHPHLVDRLVLLEATAAGFDPSGAKRLGDYFRSWTLPFKSRAAAVEALGGSSFVQAVSADLEERQDGFWPRFDPDVMEATMEFVSEPRWAEWGSVASRVLTVFAENGYFTPEERRAFLTARPGTESCELKGVGHDAHLEDPAAWLSILIEFLTRS
jgi:pimeloyl-ACP methyl ester carboxylesterase